MNSWTVNSPLAAMEGTSTAFLTPDMPRRIGLTGGGLKVKVRAVMGDLRGDPLSLRVPSHEAATMDLDADNTAHFSTACITQLQCKCNPSKGTVPIVITLTVDNLRTRRRLSAPQNTT
jgi:hypothetical protein